MLLRVALVRTYVSEELSASFIRVTRNGKLVPSSPILVTLLKEALSSSVTSVLTRATRRNILEDTIFLWFTGLFLAVTCVLVNWKRIRRPHRNRSRDLPNCSWVPQRTLLLALLWCLLRGRLTRHISADESDRSDGSLGQPWCIFVSRKGDFVHPHYSLSQPDVSHFISAGQHLTGGGEGGRVTRAHTGELGLFCDRETHTSTRNIAVSFMSFLILDYWATWLQIQRSWVLLPALPHFLRSSGSGTGSTQPREDKWGATWKKSSGSGSVGTRCAHYAILLYPQKLTIKFTVQRRLLSRYSLLADKMPRSLLIAF
jgi:hypothetical protein